MIQQPFNVKFSMESGLAETKPPMQRHLSYMKGMFSDDAAFEKDIVNDPIVYEFYDFDIPSEDSDLAFGTSITYPGKVGNEYYMTMGHFHEKFYTAETYFCLRGEGLLLMENKEGDSAFEVLVPGKMVYVPAGWAHRSINVDNKEPFITFFTFRADAGHDYGTIKQTGFRKIVIERDGKFCVVDNPKWK